MATLPLLKRRISLEEALEDDENVLHLLDYPQKLKDFKSRLTSLKAEIEATVAFHLQAICCQIADEDNWMMGNYNICTRSASTLHLTTLFLFVSPCLLKSGKKRTPRNVDEKLRCEVATYIWIHQNCPTVPIPSLYGFGFPDGRTVCSPNFWHI
jgi:hypothetical protein